MGQFELLVDEPIVELCVFSGVVVRGGEDDARRSGPVNGAHAHGAGLAGAIDRAVFQLKILQDSAGLANSYHLGVCGGVVGGQDLIVSLADDLPILDDHGAKRAARAFAHAFIRQGDSAFEKLTVGRARLHIHKNNIKSAAGTVHPCFNIIFGVMEPIFTNDAIVLGILLAVLAGIFVTAHSPRPFWKTFYKFVPSLLLAYLIPAVLNSAGLISASHSNLYFVASRYLLPASLVLLCLSIDFKGIINLGPKALIVFLAGTFGVVLGGPIALLTVIYFFPNLIPVSPDELWRGLSTIAGSWIGGSANQTAMKEIFKVDDNLFGTVVIVDVIVAYVWMGVLLYGANITDRIDRWLQADTAAIETLKQRVEAFREKVERIPSTTDTLTLMAVTFVCVGLAHWAAVNMSSWLALKDLGSLNWLEDGYFWIIVVATTLGLGLSFTPFRKLEGVGASRYGTIFIYIMVATIGMKMNLREVFDHLGLFAVGILWMLIHILVLLVVAKLIKAPFFFVAVGSQANIGGAASAPVVASAFHPALAPVGVLLAVLGYALGTYAALLCAWLMEMAASAG